MKQHKCLVFTLVALVVLSTAGVLFLPKRKELAETIMQKFRSHRNDLQSTVETTDHLTTSTEAHVWDQNMTASDFHKFRSALEKCCSARHSLLVTKMNTPVNSTIQYDGDKKKLNVTTEIWKRFLQDSPFKYKKYSSCSVVGNGGLLKDSGCGKEIDSADFVFRCNMAPVDERYVADVGNRTNLITMNPSIIRIRYGRLRKAEMRDKFVQDMSAYGDAYVWMSAFSYRWGTSLSFAAQTTLQNHQITVFVNPNFLLDLTKFWKSKGVKERRLSTGLFLASAALSICEEVRLYGFWPFHVDKNNQTLTEHYYDNRLPRKAHKMPEEFAKLQQLHNEGILQLTTNACPDHRI